MIPLKQQNGPTTLLNLIINSKLHISSTQTSIGQFFITGTKKDNS